MHRPSVPSVHAVLALALLAACDGDRGLTGPAGPAGPPGDEGPQGPPGQSSDGGAAARLYGNGSDGALNVPSGALFLPLESTGQYTSITIATGATLHVASGTLLRVTGDIDNDGTIEVDHGALAGARRYGSNMADLAPATSPPHPGIALSAAEFGSVDMSSTFVAHGGNGGRGIGRAARWHTRLLPFAGGGGAISWPFDVTSSMESGGGAFHIRVGGELRNAGTIRAAGADGLDVGLGGCGTGGGGGGAILIAAATRIDNGGGVIDVRGGTGTAADGDQCGAGGGGGGGIIHLIAPEIEAGDLQFTGGSAGTAGVYGSLRWIGGGGGGGSAGNGGRGTGRIGAAVSAASNGGPGVAYEIAADPATVL